MHTVPMFVCGRLRAFGTQSSHPLNELVMPGTQYCLDVPDLFSGHMTRHIAISPPRQVSELN